MSATAPPTADLATIEQTAALLMAPGDVAELRIPHAGKAGTVSGYFDDPGKLAQAAARYSGRAPAVYMTLNPVQPALLDRARNRVVERARHTTTDAEIVRRLWLPLDFDPVRPSGTGATAAEHAAALALANAVATLLAQHGWPEPISADSGNGAHLLYRVTLANDQAAADLTRRVLEAIAFRCQSDAVSVDTTVHNPARIWKVSGTQAAKGDSTPERPLVRGVGETLMRELVRAGRVPVLRLGRRVLIRRSTLERLLKEAEQKGKGEGTA